ncbi:MAG: bifunctional folylpolyglutamate synthase/dihydrofolate synthase [Gemmatimonadota bacterium]
MAHIRWGLDRIESILAGLGNPHRSYRSLHIGGTNGKGSVAASIEAILREAGHATGLYTSPHLVSFDERIRIAGEPVSVEWLETCAAEVLPLAEREGASFFEAATALAFLVFARAGVEVAVVEVGLGGRLDATNVLRPEVSAITNVALDHAEYLGLTLREIAAEKAGILKGGVPAVLGPVSGEVLDVFRRRAAELKAPLHVLGEMAVSEKVEVSRTGTVFRYRSPARPGGLLLRTPLIGRHQATNAAIALLALEGFEALPEAALANGLASVRWPGRVEVFDRPDGTWVLDVAHNVAGASALARTLGDIALPAPKVALLAILGDKAWKKMLVPLLSRVDAAVFTLAPSAPVERLWDPGEARRAVPDRAVELVPDFDAALCRARDLAGAGTVVVTGSCHTVGDALTSLGPQRVEPVAGGVDVARAAPYT